MAQITLEKLNENLSNLQREVKSLRSFIINIVSQDKEGKYQPEFVKRILKASKEKTIYPFKDEKSFLSHLNQ